MDPFTISCETCHASLTVRQEQAIDQIYACPHCGSMVLVQRPATGGENVSAKESTTDGMPEPAVVDKRRWSLGPSATEGVANAADPGPGLRDRSILVDTIDATPAAGSPIARDVSGPQDTVQLTTTAGLLDATRRTDDAVIGFVPNATWATSGQNWIRIWAMYGAAAFVGVVGSIALCSVIISRNDSRKNQPAAVEAEPPQSAQSKDSVMPSETAEQDASDASQHVVEPTAAPPTAHVPGLETPDLEMSDDDTLLVSTSAGHEEVSVETLTLPSPVAFNQSEVTAEVSVPEEPEAETHVAPDEVTTVESPPRQVPPREIDLGAQLAVVIPAIEFDGAELQDCLRFLSDLTTIPISIHPEALLLAGRLPNSPVRLHTEDRSVRDILNDVLRPHHLVYAIQDNQIVVTNRATGAGGLKEITYPVDDLLQDKSTTSEQLVQLITSMVAPDSWASRGGSAVAVAEDGSLVIRQTGPIHWEILQLCEKLRVVRELPLRSRYARERFELTARAERAQPNLASTVSLNYVTSHRLIEILDRIEEQTKTQILVHWLSTYKVGVYPDFETTFTVQDQPLGQALHDLLFPLGLSYRVADRAILQIISRDYMERHHEIEFHCVDDWPPDDPAGEQLAARIESALGIGGSESGHLYMVPRDRIVITRLAQPMQSKLTRYLKFRGNGKPLLDH